ncbi:MAG: hypothetical protein ACI4KA_09765 [Oscillospiraceae bacterium]
MKKRIAAAVMSSVMMFCVVTDSFRVRAFALTASAIACIGAAAITLTSIMLGVNYQDEIGEWIAESYDNVDDALAGLTNCCSGLEFCADVVSVASDLFDLYASDQITVNDQGLVSLSYYQYQLLAAELAKTCNVAVNLGTAYQYVVISSSFGTAVSINDVAKLDTFWTELGNSYVPVYYGTDKIYFCRDSFYTRYYQNSSGFYPLNYVIQSYNPIVSTVTIKFGTGSIYSDATALGYSLPYFFYSNSSIYFAQYKNSSAVAYNIDGWFVFDGNSLVMVDDITAVDLTPYRQGYMIIDGTPDIFFGDITCYETESSVNDLSGVLDDVLVLNPNPGLVVDTDPDIVIPSDAVIVTDIPAVDDMPLTDYMDDVPPRLDIDVPNTIITKFPFCLPFDLYKLLTIFVAEPEPPVIRIPISTSYDMTQFEGNETFGDSVSETFDPMFEIEEEIVIDFTGIPFVQPICYTVFIVGFIFMLIMITTKLINH